MKRSKKKNYKKRKKIYSISVEVLADQNVNQIRNKFTATFTRNRGWVNIWICSGEGFWVNFWWILARDLFKCEFKSTFIEIYTFIYNYIDEFLFNNKFNSFWIILCWINLLEGFFALTSVMFYLFICSLLIQFNL